MPNNMGISIYIKQLQPKLNNCKVEKVEHFSRHEIKVEKIEHFSCHEIYYFF